MNVQLRDDNKGWESLSFFTGGKELGNCTHQLMTNDEEITDYTTAFDKYNFRQVKLKEDRQQQKEERSREEDSFNKRKVTKCWMKEIPRVRQFKKTSYK